MGKKLDRIYEALVEGAADGLAGKELYAYVAKRSPKTSSKRIVKAALLALTDPDVKDRGVLERIYALAIDYRMSSLGVETDDHEADDDDAQAPVLSKKLKSRLRTTVSPIMPVEEGDPSVPVTSTVVH